MTRISLPKPLYKKEIFQFFFHHDVVDRFTSGLSSQSPHDVLVIVHDKDVFMDKVCKYEVFIEPEWFPTWPVMDWVEVNL